MKITKQARREAKELFRGCLVDGLLDEPRVRTAVQQTLAKKPRGYLPILSHFTRLVKLDLDRRSARVESTAPLDPGLRDRLQASLTRLYGRGVIVSFAQNPALIGGLRVKIGSDVYDGSIQAKLNALQDSF